MQPCLERDGPQAGLERVGRSAVGDGHHAPGGARPARATAGRGSHQLVGADQVAAQGRVRNGQRLRERERPGAVEHRAQRGGDEAAVVPVVEVGPVQPDGLQVPFGAREGGPAPARHRHVRHVTGRELLQGPQPCRRLVGHHAAQAHRRLERRRARGQGVGAAGQAKEPTLRDGALHRPPRQLATQPCPGRRAPAGRDHGDHAVHPVDLPLLHAADCGRTVTPRATVPGRLWTHRLAGRRLWTAPRHDSSKVPAGVPATAATPARTARVAEVRTGRWRTCPPGGTPRGGRRRARGC